jgi:hypothetical protein
LERNDSQRGVADFAQEVCKMSQLDFPKATQAVALTPRSNLPPCQSLR